MEYLIHGFEPKRLFEHFEELSAIPRPSGSEAAAAAFLMRFAEGLGLEAHCDARHNVVIKKPGQGGGEDRPALLLQGHLDMVCEKNADTLHDFTSEGIRLIQTGGLLHADGTTLGADNGIAVAMMMALLEEPDVPHPPLECVFTTEEETGLTGARMLDGSLLSARTMINLDSEEEGIATVSCAGGMRVYLVRECRMEPAGPLGAQGIALRIRGLRGGHSGTDIPLERGNANKLMGRILQRLTEEASFRIARCEGGSKDNAIPRECDCVLVPDSASDAARIRELAAAEAGEIGAEYAAQDPGFSLLVEEVSAGDVLDRESGWALIDLLFLAPDGVQSRNVKAGGFAVSSLNLGVVRTERTEDGSMRLTVVFAPRSSVASRIRLIRRQLVRLGERLGFSARITSEYPGWAYAEHSPIRTVMQECYKELYGKELRCEAIHAGLECGLFSEKLPGLDAVAIGPGMTGVHTPDETLDLASVERTYRLLVRVLARLAGA